MTSFVVESSDTSVLVSVGSLMTSFVVESSDKNVPVSFQNFKCSFERGECP